MQSTDQVKGLFQGGSQWHTAKVHDVLHSLCVLQHTVNAMEMTAGAAVHQLAADCLGVCPQEVKQQTMADYGAELQAQIAEKERQKKLRRQNSLRESQQLMAQRMMVPSGLVSP